MVYQESRESSWRQEEKKKKAENENIPRRLKVSHSCSRLGNLQKRVAARLKEVRRTPPARNDQNVSLYSYIHKNGTCSDYRELQSCKIGPRSFEGKRKEDSIKH